MGDSPVPAVVLELLALLLRPIVWGEAVGDSHGCEPADECFGGLLGGYSTRLFLNGAMLGQPLR